MFDTLFMLLTLCIVMAIASFLAGSLPLSFSLSQSQLRLLSTLGMGVLVGTSLVVIIPEGIETLYSASSHTHAHRRRDLSTTNSLAIRWATSPVGPPLSISRAEREVRANNDKPEADAFSAMPGPVIPAGAGSSSSSSKAPTSQDFPDDTLHIWQGEEKTESSKNNDKTEDASEESSPHAWVGLSLILGFILMYLIDQIPQIGSALAQAQRAPYHISLRNLSNVSRGFHHVSSLGLDGTEGDEESFPQPESTSRQSRGVSTTLGLVIHAAADGIALGASSTMASKSLGLIVFLAIMLHKAPAAFGLTSVLLKQGLTKREARAHLVIFSLAAPAGAVITWLIVNLLGSGQAGGEEGTTWWTGILLLFSAGTFLYVAMHTMQEDKHLEDTPGLNGYADGPIPRKEGPTFRDTLAAVVGMLIPLVTQIGHAH